MELLILMEAADRVPSDDLPQDYQLVMSDETNEPNGSTVPAVADPWQKLVSVLAESWPEQRWRDVGVVVGCSGGADSVCLLRALASCRDQGGPPARGFLVAAHFNHRLRGDESDADQRFVQQLAGELGIDFVCQQSQSAMADEASMRQQRVEFLTITAHRLGARYVALAHSADDNIETVLHNLLRGTGPSGLAGIRAYRSLDADLVLVRPLLPVRRQRIRQALHSIGQCWREDRSNRDLDYRRNWIRHQVIPTLQQQFPQAGEAILRAIDGQQQWRDLIQSLAENWIDDHQTDSDPVTLRCGPETPEAVVVAACQTIWDRQDWPRQEMSRAHWKRLAEAIQSTQSTRFALPGGIDVSVGASIVEIRR